MTDRDSSTEAADTGPLSGRGPRMWSRSDTKIREDVAERLRQDRLIDARNVEVRVQDGVVVLEGHVPGASDVQHAEAIARQAPGVAGVRNALVFEPGPRRIDRPDHEEPMGQRTKWGKWVPPFFT